MDVILNQDVKALGKKGQLVKVSDGYARNFLFPRNLAVEANAGNLNSMKIRDAALQHHKDMEKQAAQELKKRLDTVTVRIQEKAGANGKLFGSVTSKEIAEQLKKAEGVDVDKKKISLADPIKAFGSYKVDLKLYPEIVATITVSVTELGTK